MVPGIGSFRRLISFKWTAQSLPVKLGCLDMTEDAYFASFLCQKGQKRDFETFVGFKFSCPWNTIHRDTFRILFDPRMFYSPSTTEQSSLFRLTLTLSREITSQTWYVSLLSAKAPSLLCPPRMDAFSSCIVRIKAGSCIDGESRRNLLLPC